MYNCKENEHLQREFQEKNEVNEELNKALLKLRIEFKEVLEQREQEISFQHQQMTDLRDISEGKGNTIRKMNEEIEAKEKEVSCCKIS